MLPRGLRAALERLVLHDLHGPADGDEEELTQGEGQVLGRPCQ